MTQHATVTVEDLTQPGTDVSNATTLDQLQVIVNVPFRDVRWTTLTLVTNASTLLTNRATWVSCVDNLYQLPNLVPPQG